MGGWDSWEPLGNVGRDRWRPSEPNNILEPDTSVGVRDAGCQWEPPVLGKRALTGFPEGYLP